MMDARLWDSHQGLSTHGSWQLGLEAQAEVHILAASGAAGWYSSLNQMPISFTARALTHLLAVTPHGGCFARRAIS